MELTIHRPDKKAIPHQRGIAFLRQEKPASIVVDAGLNRKARASYARGVRMAAWAAASRAMGTRKGEQET